MKTIDLTHTLTSDVATFDGGCGFTLSTNCDYKDCIEPNTFRTQNVTCCAGIGTHMDAPAHCVIGGRTIEKLELAELITDCVVMAVDAADDQDFLILPSVVEEFEKKHGEIKPNTFVIFHTGWEKYWGDAKKFRNNLSFPSVHASTAELLLKRDIAGLGIDTLSADAKGRDFPVHRLFLGAGKYLVENVANAKSLPPTGSRICVLPMKIKDATEAPVRLIGLY